MLQDGIDAELCKEALHSLCIEQVPVPSFRDHGFPPGIIQSSDAILSSLCGTLETHFIGLVYTGYLPLSIRHVEEMVSLVSETVSEMWLESFHVLRGHIRDSTHARRETFHDISDEGAPVNIPFEFQRLGQLVVEAVRVVVHRVRDLWQLFLDEIKDAEPQPLAWIGFEDFTDFVDSTMFQSQHKDTGSLMLAVFLYGMEEWASDFMHDSECALVCARRLLRGLVRHCPRPAVDFVDFSVLLPMSSVAETVADLCCITKFDAVEFIKRNGLASRLADDTTLQSLFGVVHRVLSSPMRDTVPSMCLDRGILPANTIRMAVNTRRWLRRAFSDAFSKKWPMDFSVLPFTDLLAVLEMAFMFVLPWATNHVKLWSKKLAKCIVSYIKKSSRNSLGDSDTESTESDGGSSEDREYVYDYLAASMVVHKPDGQVRIKMLPLIVHLRGLHQRRSERRPALSTQPIADATRHDFDMTSVNPVLRAFVFGCCNPYDAENSSAHSCALVADVGAYMLRMPEQRLVACAAALVWRGAQKYASSKNRLRPPSSEEGAGGTPQHFRRKRKLTIQCSVCYDESATSLCGADHSLCNACAVRLITNRVLSAFVQGRTGCKEDDAEPFTGKDVFACAFPGCSNRLEWAVDSLPSDIRYFAKQLQIRIAQDGLFASGGVECATCETVFVPSTEESAALIAKCPRCWYQTCLRCVGAFHPGKVCPAALRSGELTPQALLSEAKIQKCPGEGCGIGTTKLGGCNHMNCDHCKTDWCWSCGQQIRGSVLAHYESSKACMHFYYSLDSEVRRIEAFIHKKSDVAEDVRAEALALLHTTMSQKPDDL